MKRFFEFLLLFFFVVIFLLADDILGLAMDKCPPLLVLLFAGMFVESSGCLPKVAGFLLFIVGFVYFIVWLFI